MDSMHASDVAGHRDWLLSLAPVPAAGLWVDLGCGTGSDAISLATRHPQPGLRILGLDESAKSIESAALAASRDSRVGFRQHKLGDRLPFEDDTVDIAFSNNLIECLGDRSAFARELARVLRPGGTLVMAHWDWDSQLFDGGDKALERRLVHAFADWQQAWMDHADGWMGRRLWGMFNASGLFGGSIQTRVLTNTIYGPPWFGHARAQDFKSLVKRNLATADDCQRFLSEQEELNEQGRYFYSVTGFAYVATLRAA